MRSSDSLTDLRCDFTCCISKILNLIDQIYWYRNHISSNCHALLRSTPSSGTCGSTEIRLPVPWTWVPIVARSQRIPEPLTTFTWQEGLDDVFCASCTYTNCIDEIAMMITVRSPSTNAAPCITICREISSVAGRVTVQEPGMIEYKSLSSIIISIF